MQHFRRAFDYPERVANLMRQTGGHLPESRQALRAARFLLRLLQLAIGFRQRFGELLIALDLPPIFHHEAVDHHGGKEKEEDADGKLAVALRSDFIALQGPIKAGAKYGEGLRQPE